MGFFWIRSVYLVQFIHFISGYSYILGLYSLLYRIIELFCFRLFRIIFILSCIFRTQLKHLGQTVSTSLVKSNLRLVNLPVFDRNGVPLQPVHAKTLLFIFWTEPCPCYSWVPPAGSFLSRQEAPQECGLRRRCHKPMFQGSDCPRQSFILIRCATHRPPLRILPASEPTGIVPGSTIGNQRRNIADQ